MGFRSPEFNPEKAPGTTRLIFIGSSTVFGVGNSLENTFPYQVEQILDEALPEHKIEVINAALPNKTSDWEVERIREVFPLKPDVVVMMTGYNDSATVHEERVDTRDDGTLQITPWVFRLNAFLIEHSIFYVTLREKIALLRYGNPRFAFGSPQEIERQEKRGAAEWFERFPPHFRENLERMTQLALEEEVDLIFLKPPLSAERRKNHPLYTKAFLALVKELEAAARQKQIPLIDLETAFLKVPSSEYFSDDGLHFTDHGNLVIAKAVSEFFLNHQSIYFPGGEI